ncbi:MAG: alpha/beta fold hydrolase [Thermoflexales bacterium]|nr:alpha/beta fold hydrolase [Thermoflexales bacterium]
MAEYAVRGAAIDQVQPFGFDRGPIGCVLLHGFTAAPKEMRPLGEYLAERDVTVRGVLLAGHGTCPADLARTTQRDWVASAEAAIDELRGRCRQVWAIGLSLGGLISLHLAANQRVDGVIALAPPILTPNRLVPLARFIAPFKPYFVKGLANLHDPVALAEHADYTQFPTRAVAQMYTLIRQVQRELPRITVPLMLIHARHDEVVALDGADYIWSRVSSAQKERVLLGRGGHIITEDYDRDVAFEQIGSFLARYSR